MHEKHLRSFLAVYRSGSLVQAAEQLNISQPALSRRLSEFQSQVGVKLFEPHGRGIARTHDAERLHPLVLEAFDAVAKLKSAAEDNQREDVTPITIAATPHTIEGVIAAQLVSHHKKRPNVAFSLVEAGGAEIEQLVLSGKVHVGLSARPNLEAGLMERHIVRLTFCAVSGEPFTRRERSKGIDLNTLCRRPLILFDHRFQSRLVLDAALRLEALSPRIVHESGSAGVIESLATAGLGTGIVLSNNTSALPKAQITVREEPLWLNLNAVWDPTISIRSEIEQFVDALCVSWPGT